MTRSTEFDSAKAAQAYLPLMHEFTIRAELVAQAFDGHLGLTTPFAREFAYLQFRRMCELIALGCLYLHGNLPITQQKALTKEWNAERIMKLMRKHHPFAYPQAINTIKTEQGWHIEGNCKPNALSYSEYLQLYAECGEVLHRGTIRTVHAGTFCTAAAYDKAVSWQNKLITLMKEHLIPSPNLNIYYVSALKIKSGYPQCSIFHYNEAGEVIIDIQNFTVSDAITDSYVSNNYI